MDIRWTTGFLDSPSAAAEPFWLAVTGASLSARRGGGVFATLQPAAGDAYLRVQVTGSPPRTHLDLHVTDVPQAAREAVALGVSVVHAEDGLVVVRSPGGIEFCLVAWDGESVRPAAVTWPGGQRSLVDQLCLDIPAPIFEAEADFWVALTGWPRRRTDLPKFDYLQRPPGLPLRLLLQRTGAAAVASPSDGSPVAEKAGMHVDLACDDVDAEVARHVALGASVVRRVPDDWTTLRDPGGREYCVTGRSPQFG